MRDRDGFEGAARGAADVPAMGADSSWDRDAEGGLNSRYTFANFVVGESNRFAHEVARLSADFPGRFHNPLYLHGGVGLGKTHLATAIAHATRAHGQREDVRVVSAGRFRDRCERLARSGSDPLDVALARARLVVFDDVQLLARDDRVLEAFFACFDGVLGEGRQVVLTCDLPPPAIPALALRLKSRWETALAAEIRAPEPELRRAIVRRSAALVGAPIGEDVVDFIADSEQDSVRALEGAFRRVRGLAAMTSRELSLAVARQALEGGGGPSTSTPRSLDAVVEAAAAAFGLSGRELRSRRRRDRVASLARQVAVHVARGVSSQSLAVIAADLGFRDHSAAAHAGARLRARLACEPELAARVAAIEREIGRSAGTGRPGPRSR